MNNTDFKCPISPFVSNNSLIQSPFMLIKMNNSCNPSYNLMSPTIKQQDQYLQKNPFKSPMNPFKQTPTSSKLAQQLIMKSPYGMKDIFNEGQGLEIFKTPINIKKESMEDIKIKKCLDFNQFSYDHNEDNMDNHCCLQDILQSCNINYSPYPIQKFQKNDLVSPYIKPFYNLQTKLVESSTASQSSEQQQISEEQQQILLQTPIGKLLDFNQVISLQNDEFLIPIQQGQNFQQLLQQQEIQSYNDENLTQESKIKINTSKAKTTSKKQKHNKNIRSKREFKQQSKTQTLLDKLLSANDKKQDKKKDTQQSNKIVKKCTCTKSKCLKLYCECFANGQVCGIECGCKDCYNQQQNQNLIKSAKEDIIKRDPSAFNSKITHNNTGKRYQHRKGCTCKKSGCLKGYCECYQLGVVCTEWCKCSGCSNCKSVVKTKDQEYSGQIFRSNKKEKKE